MKKIRRPNESAIDLSNANHARGHKEVRRSTGHIMVTTRHSNQKGSESRQNLSSREHRKLIGVKTVSFRTNYSFNCLEYCHYFRIWITSYRKDCLMWSPSNEVIKSDPPSFSGSQRVTQRQVMRRFTSNGTDQCQNGSSNLLTPYRKQPRSTRIVVAYTRPAFSATKRINYAPISYDQQAQVSQGPTSSRNKKKGNIEVHDGGGIGLLKPAREPASSRPKLYASLKKAPRIFPVHRSLLALV